MKTALSLLGCLLLGAGCASTPDPSSYLREQSEGFPVFAAFVYEEEVHAVGGTFSTDQVFWKSAYPVVAQSVQKANRFANYNDAVTSGADLIVIAKNKVYGSRDMYKNSLVLYVRDPGQNLLAETGYQGKQTAKSDEAATFRTLGVLMRDHIRSSEKVKALVRRVNKK